jgi:hypothetical protein
VERGVDVDGGAAVGVELVDGGGVDRDLAVAGVPLLDARLPG